MADRDEEREGHRAADAEDVDLLRERVEHAELVGDLRAADDRDERPLRRTEEAAEDLHLPGELAPRGAREV